MAAETIEGRVARLERKERRRALEDRQAKLKADGYTGNLHNPEDQRAIAQEVCESCGERTLRYLGAMVALNPWSCIGFYDCTVCGFWSEF